MMLGAGLTPVALAEKVAVSREMVADLEVGKIGNAIRRGKSEKTGVNSHWNQ